MDDIYLTVTIFDIINSIIKIVFINPFIHKLVSFAENRLTPWKPI